MKQGYNDPIVTYDEIVNALKSIIECSLDNSYGDDFDYLNIKYESGTKTKIDGAEERALLNAIRLLEKNIDTASKMIKSGLERELIDIEKSIFKIRSDYSIGQEKRKLSAQQLFVDKLRAASLKIDVLYHAPQHEEQEKIEDLNSFEEVDTNKIFSDFEKNAIMNFPEFFKEELAIASQSQMIDSSIPVKTEIEVKPEEELNIDVTDLFSTLKLEPGENNEDVAISDFIGSKNEQRIDLLKRAIKKAEMIGNQNLINKLKEELDKELNGK